MPLMSSAVLRAQLANRIRGSSPEEWAEFTNLWMAFNAIYGGEPDKKERARVMACVRRYFSENAARQVLRSVTPQVKRILTIPPANLLLNRDDPTFRAASERCAACYRDPAEPAVGRLAAVAGVIYQVRCNLLHGSKDPDDQRDQMLVRDSASVLRALLPALEERIFDRG